MNDATVVNVSDEEMERIIKPAPFRSGFAGHYLSFEKRATGRFVAIRKRLIGWTVIWKPERLSAVRSVWFLRRSEAITQANLFWRCLI